MQCMAEFSRAISPQAKGGAKPKPSEAKSDVGNALLGMMPLGITDGQGSIGTAVSGCTQAGAFATSETCADELALIW